MSQLFSIYHISILLSDILDDNSQTVISAHTTDRSRTPSPQKSISTTIVPSISITPPKTNTNLLSPTTAQSPVYSFLSNNPPPSDTTKTLPIQKTPSSSLNMFAPKPFRSTASINVDTQNNHESVRIHLLFSKHFLFSYKFRK